MESSSKSHSYQNSKIPEPNNVRNLKDNNNNNNNRAISSNLSEKKPASAIPKPEEQKPPSVDDDINENAEAFIQKFRHQLLLERLESIENYEQMLARGL